MDYFYISETLIDAHTFLTDVLTFDDVKYIRKKASFVNKLSISSNNRKDYNFVFQSGLWKVYWSYGNKVEVDSSNLLVAIPKHIWRGDFATYVKVNRFITHLQNNSYVRNRSEALTGEEYIKLF